ncbi:hypothetical protein GCM10011386_38890 [Parapedobacter defluvii]|uniref:DUF4325 domain-containing protein n=1 Tax=Parapedobacter defluvii TaxID=2045106 RepID=A0ABQ1MMJ5_9SPHI|nr:hypothetical protein GCM10011386_38890 [Parapedobacter defluvii]
MIGLRAYPTGRKCSDVFCSFPRNIGQLYSQFSEEDIRERLTGEDLSKSGAVSLKRVVDTAKIYYKNPDILEQSIKDILGE